MGAPAAAADFDADGRWDLAVGQNGAETLIFRGRGGPPGLRVRLGAAAGGSAIIGARLRLRYADGTEGPSREIQAGSGYWSLNGAVQVFGRAAEIRAVHVRWADGLEEVFDIRFGGAGGDAEKGRGLVNRAVGLLAAGLFATGLLAACGGSGADPSRPAPGTAEMAARLRVLADSADPLLDEQLNTARLGYFTSLPPSGDPAEMLVRVAMAARELLNAGRTQSALEQLIFLDQTLDAGPAEPVPGFRREVEELIGVAFLRLGAETRVPVRPPARRDRRPVGGTVPVLAHRAPGRTRTRLGLGARGPRRRPGVAPRPAGVTPR